MKKSEEGNWDIAAFLDLGDSKISCYVFELAICISYMCLVSPNLLDAGGHVLAGYQTVRSLSETELHILKVSGLFYIIALFRNENPILKVTIW